ncbi:hypothetical protein Q8A67_000096 [Cirrhinus molitorella]|uniref:Uncharacterized protein n=1 Tax=Cirrhinus molitorella TaxID=172907 RepID=A0AA88QC29_9TELE|nr:hypothetical protein Q8A67_000096 [Cirrhinus molitorella]
MPCKISRPFVLCCFRDVTDNCVKQSTILAGGSTSGLRFALASVIRLKKVKMAFIKEESEDMKIEDVKADKVFRVKQEDTEEQTDLIEESKELKDKEEKEQNDKDHDFKIGEKYTQAKKLRLAPAAVIRLKKGIKMEFIKKESEDVKIEDIKIEEVFGVKQEDMEEQTDLIEERSKTNPLHTPKDRTKRTTDQLRQNMSQLLTQICETKAWLL